MKTCDYTIEVKKRGEVVSLYPLTDFHIGNKTFDEGNLKDTIAQIVADPLARVILLGDICEFIGRKDPRFMTEGIPDRFLKDLDNIFMSQCDYAIELLKPIADKIIGMHGGNHEESVIRHDSFDPLAYIMNILTKHLGYPIINLGYGGAFTRLKIKRAVKGKAAATSIIVINSFHGCGGGEYKGAKANRLQRALGKFDADIYLRGHTHELFGFCQPTIGVPRRGKKQVLARPHVLAYCGCYFQTYAKDVASYGEKKDYFPTEIGTPIIQIHTEPLSFTIQQTTRTGDLSRLTDFSE